MNIRQLKQFICVAKHGSMTKAAAELFITQQALSKAMGLLQEEVHDKLFFQTSTGLQLTSFGSKLLSISLSLSQYYDSCMGMIDKLVEENLSSLTVVCEHSSFQYAIPDELSGKYRVTSALVNGLDICLEQVRSGAANMALCDLPDDLTDFKYYRIVSEPLMFLMSKDHPLARKEILTMQDIRDVPQATYPPFTRVMLQFIDACINEGFYPNFTYESQDLGILANALLSDDRIQLCASYVRASTGSDRLTLVPLNHKSLWRDMGFVVRKDNKNEQVTHFIESVQSYYKSRTTFYSNS